MVEGLGERVNGEKGITRKYPPLLPPFVARVARKGVSSLWPAPRNDERGEGPKQELTDIPKLAAGTGAYELSGAFDSGVMKAGYDYCITR